MYKFKDAFAGVVVSTWSFLLSVRVSNVRITYQRLPAHIDHVSDTGSTGNHPLAQKSKRQAPDGGDFYVLCILNLLGMNELQPLKLPIEFKELCGFGILFEI
ncbi:unnamed protein product [Allacma fusca]|uniref:Uncharacterized protein n=1 Tax=Allacma fusca TaxID=39272 RepID=A0A8J2LDQ1_9HEXA|nr:unnamed protein product [Allacma fusca]